MNTRNTTFIIVVILCCIAVARTFSFSLSSLFGDDEDFQSQRPTFPRRDLAQELGEDSYQTLILNSLQETEESYNAGNQYRYGVDVSFPIHHFDAQSNSPHSFGQSRYAQYIEGCREIYESKARLCDETEDTRLDMNKNQPPVMQNYTALGFKKTRVKDDVFHSLRRFWVDNESFKYIERWSAGDTHINHWASPSYFYMIKGEKLKDKVTRAAHDAIWDWIDADISSLFPTSLYGIREYSRGAILAPHVDRLPLVLSAIINVAQDVEEPWPLEVYGHDGRAYNVTLEPGEMLLYESQSVIHGRPFPLNGRSYANVFVHFEPEGHCMNHMARMDGKQVATNAEDLYETARKKLLENVNLQDDLPDYIPNSMRNRWKQQLKYESEPESSGPMVKPKGAGLAASRGNYQAILRLSQTDPDALRESDVNGWQPLHEAARAGHTNIVKLLLKKEFKIDINARTNNGRGGSPLWWAETSHEKDHPIIKVLEEAGALSIPPGLDDDANSNDEDDDDFYDDDDDDDDDGHFKQDDDEL